MAEEAQWAPHEIPEDYPTSKTLELLEVYDYRKKDFVLLYVLGDEHVRGVAYKSYLAAGFPAKNNNSASVGASQLMKEPLIKKAIAELREEMELEFKARMIPWASMAVKAQKLLDRYMETILNPATAQSSGQVTLLGTNALVAINMVLDRALGKPTQTKKSEIGDNLAEAIKRVASNAAENKLSLKAPEPTGGLTRHECVQEVFPSEPDLPPHPRGLEQ